MARMSKADVAKYWKAYYNGYRAGKRDMECDILQAMTRSLEVAHRLAKEVERNLRDFNREGRRIQAQKKEGGEE